MTDEGRRDFPAGPWVPKAKETPAIVRARKRLEKRKAETPPDLFAGQADETPGQLNLDLG